MTIIDKLKQYNFSVIFFILSVIYIIFAEYYRSQIFTADILNINSLLFRFFSDVFIILIGQFCNYLIIQLKKRTPFFERLTISFSIIFSVSFLLFYFTGYASFNWDMWDSFSVFQNAVKYDYFSYQHIYTVIYYIIALNLFPFKGGVILFQIILSSLIFSYIWAKFSEINNLKYKWILLFPLFLFPVLRMNIQPIRSCMYYVFILLLYAVFYFSYKENKNFSYLKIFFYSLLAAIVCAWRTENAPLLLIIPFILLLFDRNKLSLVKIYIFLFIFYSVSFVTNCLMADKYYMYGLLPFKRPLSAILKTDFKTNDKQNDLYIISKCFSPQGLKDAELNKSLDVPMENPNKHDINNFIKTSLKLIILNPKTFIAERSNLSCYYTNFYLLSDAIFNYDENSLTYKIIRNLEFYRPLMPVNYYFILNYSPIIPLLFLFIAFITALIKKQKMNAVIFFTSITLSIVSYVFCAEPFFHYFLQSYILGWFIFAYFIVFLLNKIRNLIIIFKSQK